MEPRSGVHHPKAHAEGSYHVVVSPDVSGGAPAGRAAYRDEYQFDYGPDLDEPFDQTESGHEFLVPVLQAEPS